MATLNMDDERAEESRLSTVSDCLEDSKLVHLAGESNREAVNLAGDNNSGVPRIPTAEDLAFPLLDPIAVRVSKSSEQSTREDDGETLSFLPASFASRSNSPFSPPRWSQHSHQPTFASSPKGLAGSAANYKKTTAPNFHRADTSISSHKQEQESLELEMHTHARKGVSLAHQLSPLSPSSHSGGCVDQASAKLLNGPPFHEVNSPQLNDGAASTWWSVKLGRTLFYIIMWYLFSLCLSLYNKFLLGNKHGHFPAPLLMTTLHFTMQFCVATFLLRCICPSWRQAKVLTWRDYFLRVVPTAVATAADIGLSNLALAVITLTFYTMCKASAPVFLLLFAFTFALESPSLKLLGVIIVISIGVLLTVAGETEFDLTGFILVMLASVMSGLRWVLIQVLLQKEKLGLTNPLVTLAYLTPVMSLVCGILSLVLEPWTELAQSSYFATWHDTSKSFGVMLLGGILAFFMIMTEFLLISETSAVTFSVAGTAKEGFTIIISHFVFNDRFTSWNTAGLVIMVLGVSLFNVYKLQRGKEGRPPGHPPSTKGTELDGEFEERELLVDLVVDSQTPVLDTHALEPHGGAHPLIPKPSPSPRAGPSPRTSLSPRATPSPRGSSPRLSPSPRAIEILRGEGELLGGGGHVAIDDGPWKSPRGLSSPGSAGLHERRVEDKVAARMG